MVPTSDQIGEPLLESQKIFSVPLEFLWCDELDGGIDNLEKATVSVRRMQTKR